MNTSDNFANVLARCVSQTPMSMHTRLRNIGYSFLNICTLILHSLDVETIYKYASLLKWARLLDMTAL